MLKELVLCILEAQPVQRACGSSAGVGADARPLDRPLKALGLDKARARNKWLAKMNLGQALGATLLPHHRKQGSGVQCELT